MYLTNATCINKLNAPLFTDKSIMNRMKFAKQTRCQLAKENINIMKIKIESKVDSSSSERHSRRILLK